MEYYTQMLGEKDGIFLYRRVVFPQKVLSDIQALLSKVPEPFDAEALNTVGILIKEIISKYKKVMSGVGC